MLLSKTIFQHYLHCPKDCWLKQHKPELREKFELSEFERHIMEQGNEVESYARNLSLFRGGVEVVSRGEQAVEETLRLMTEQVPTIFQATFIAEDYIVRNDMLKWNSETSLWDLYEVKGTNSLKEKSKERDHVTDLAFQTTVMRAARAPLGRRFLVHLNKEYVRAGELDIEALFTIEDITEKADARAQEIEPKMEAAREYLNREVEPPGGCECVYATRRNHCTMFQYSNGHIPEYSVHDISRVDKTKLATMVEQKVFTLDDVDPELYKLSVKQANQVVAYQTRRPVIDTKAVAEQLESLRYPLYFFDYEAYAPAIPAFPGYAPYKFIPFQFSMDILRAPGATLEHVDFLHEEFSDPSEAVVAKLRELFTGGTVIVWHENFEKNFVNANIALRLPQHAEFIREFNTAIFDLEKIFLAQHYIHPGFKGRTSIKVVLPVIAPELTYADLEIHEGGQASNEWWHMVSPTIPPEEKQSIAKNLKEYCGRDTYAMYAIWEHLNKLVATEATREAIEN